MLSQHVKLHITITSVSLPLCTRVRFSFNSIPCENDFSCNFNKKKYIIQTTTAKKFFIVEQEERNYFGMKSANATCLIRVKARRLAWMTARLEGEAKRLKNKNRSSRKIYIFRNSNNKKCFFFRIVRSQIAFQDQGKTSTDTLYCSEWVYAKISLFCCCESNSLNLWRRQVHWKLKLITFSARRWEWQYGNAILIQFPYHTNLLFMEIHSSIDGISIILELKETPSTSCFSKI